MWISSQHSSRCGNSGFTLVELLFTFAIIGILATIVLVGVSKARIAARDSQRMKDIETIQAAVEVYYRDNGHYPISSCTNNSGCGLNQATNKIACFVGFDSAYNTNTVCDSYQTAGTQTFAQALGKYVTAPLHDPVPSIGGYVYRSDTGADYCIVDLFSPENLNDFPKTMLDPFWCSVVGSDGQCSTGGPNGKSNTIYYGTGQFAASGC